MGSRFGDDQINNGGYRVPESNYGTAVNQPRRLGLPEVLSRIRHICAFPTSSPIALGPSIRTGPIRPLTVPPLTVQLPAI